MAGTFFDVFRGMGATNGGDEQSPTGTQQPQRGNSFLGGLNPDMLMAISQGLLTGKTPQEQLSGAIVGAYNSRVAQREQAKYYEKENRTRAWLKEKHPDLLPMMDAGVSPRDLMAFVYKRQEEQQKAQAPSRKFQALPNGDYGYFDDKAGSWTPLGTGAKAESQPALVQEFKFAKENGYQGTFTEYAQTKRAGGSGTGGDAGFKVPPGYRLKDPTNPSLGVDPIPGGPAEEIPGELAARLGMAKSFLERAPALRQKLANGDVTGPWDQRFAQNGIGERGQVYQELESGVDVLMRLLTGAGMNQTEAEAYARRYLPGSADTADTAVQKLDRLTQELQATASEAGKGRGGFQSPRQRGGRIDDLVKKYGG
ncbi:hypothetical protein [Shinella sp.]|uniref:hypothetical protein n=1 Tax=Shinella sp. TaxID=1870904 RepID=UPI003F71B652